MDFSKSLGKNVAVVAVLAAGVAVQACSDDTTTNGGGAGGSAGKGGTTGSAGAAGVVNSSGGAGAGSGGQATGGIAGSTSGGTAGTAGAGGTGGDAGGTAGAGGTGGAGSTILYDFEDGVQGWTADAEVTLAADPAQFVTGAQSLKATVPMLAAEASEMIKVDSPPIWPGTMVTINVWVPAGTDGLYVQGFTLGDNYGAFTAHPLAVALVRGGWNAISFSVPDAATIFPGGLQQLGVQVGVGTGGVAFAGGDFYIDSVTVSGGTMDCSGTGTGTYDFETDTTPWAVDGAPADTALAQSTAQYHGGANSLAVTFTDLPAPEAGMTSTNRLVMLGLQNTEIKAYCGDAITAHVWIPTGSETIKFQIYGQYNNYTKFTGSTPAAVTYDAWTMHSYTIPASGDDAVGPGGLQRIGIEFQYTGATPYTGTVYIDDVSWQ